MLFMRKLVIASGNAHKIQEISAMLPGFEVIGQKDIGFNQDIEENGTTFEANALIKAKAIYDFCHLPTLADDSGLCVDALNGQPGIYSARYLGHDTSYAFKNRKILEALDGLDQSKRGAQFVCAMAYIDSKGEEHVVKAILNGYINTCIEGDHGFGYDPIFVPDGYNHSIALMDESEKNKISHRHLALEKMVNIIEADLD